MNKAMKELTEKWKKGELPTPDRAANNPPEEKGGAMNKNQKKVIIVTICVLIGMFLFPPFEINWSNRTHNSGFALIFDPPHVRAVINMTQLMAQEAVAIVVGAGLWFMAKD